MTDIPPLPAGFQIVPQQPTASAPPLPAGFQLEQSSAPPQAAPDTSGIIPQALSGMNEGVGNLLSLPNSIEMGLRSIGPGIGNALGGDFAMPTESWLPDAGAQFKDLGQTVGAIKPETDQPVGRFARRVGQEVGANLIPAAAPERIAAKAGTLMASVGGGTGAAIAQQVFPGNPGAEIAGQMLGGGLSLGGMNMAERSMLSKSNATVDGLASEAGSLYEAARKSGVVAPRATVQSLAQQMKDIATNEGIISPTGRINSTYPKISEALHTIDDYALGDMTVPQMQAVRKVMTDAAKSVEPGERRLAVLMLEQMDNMSSSLAPQLKQANAIYHRAMNAGQIEDLITLARQKSGQYGRSLDATLREQFGTLERDIIKGTERGWSPEEIAAISKVAQGGPIESVLSLFSKLAPSGIVSGGASFGIPFAVGNTVGGPVLGATLGGSSVGLGIGSRAAASAMTKSSARKAVIEALMAGNKPIVPMVGQVARQAAPALAAGQAANAGPVALALLRAQGLN